MVEGILRVLGLPEAEAQALANMAVALPPIADDSLLARTERVRLAREAG